ncbi:hypothetical protein B0H14DRAFT_3503275 [Mycena olivaceomarginata]|nr:hypothetical protein B0H14DRAFT_3503275 [Mycena olivaceomarginata]
MDERLDLTALHDTQIIDDKSFLHVYNTFTTIIIPASEEAYGCKIRAQIRFMGGAIRTIRDTNTPDLLHGARLVYNQLSHDFHDTHPHGQTFLQFAILQRRQLHRNLFAERTSEIRRHKEAADCYKITAALKGGSAKCLVTPGEYIELPITVNDPHSDKLEPPNMAKPWLTTKSVIEIKQRVLDNPFIWPRPATLTDFHALLCKGTPRPAPAPLLTCTPTPPPPPHPTPCSPMPPLRSTPSSPTLPPASRSPPPPTPPPADFQRGERHVDVSALMPPLHSTPSSPMLPPSMPPVSRSPPPPTPPLADFQLGERHVDVSALIVDSALVLNYDLSYQWSFPFHSRWVRRALEEQLATPKRHSSMFSSAHSEALICLIHALLNLTHPLPSHLLPSSTNALVFQ